MRSFTFVKLIKDYFCILDNDKSYTEYDLLIQFYLASKSGSKELPKFLITKKDQGEWVKEILSSPNTSTHYYLTYSGFVEAIIRVLHDKYRVHIKEEYRFSTILHRFFKSMEFKEAHKNISSVCFKIKKNLVCNEIQHVY